MPDLLQWADRARDMGHPVYLLAMPLKSNIYEKYIEVCLVPQKIDKVPNPKYHLICLEKSEYQKDDKGINYCYVNENKNKNYFEASCMFDHGMFRWKRLVAKYIVD